MRAVYAGSFDPVTNGHLDIICRAAPLFDELVVAVGVSSSKKPWFSQEERMQMIRDSVWRVKKISTSDREKISISSFPAKTLLVDWAKENGIGVIVRGIRVLSDFDPEFRMGLANRDLSGLETVFLLTSPGDIFVSSSMTKEVGSCCQDRNDLERKLDKYLPYASLTAMRDRLFPETPRIT